MTVRASASRDDMPEMARAQFTVDLALCEIHPDAESYIYAELGRPLIEHLLRFVEGEGFNLTFRNTMPSTSYRAEYLGRMEPVAHGHLLTENTPHQGELRGLDRARGRKY